MTDNGSGMTEPRGRRRSPRPSSWWGGGLPPRLSPSGFELRPSLRPLPSAPNVDFVPTPLMAGSHVQQFVSMGNGYHRSTRQYHWLMPISCHFQHSKVLLKRFSSTRRPISSKCNWPSRTHKVSVWEVDCSRPLSEGSRPSTFSLAKTVNALPRHQQVHGFNFYALTYQPVVQAVQWTGAPELLTAPSYTRLHAWQKSEMIHLHSAHTIFHSRRGHLRTKKHQNSWQQQQQILFARKKHKHNIRKIKII